MTVRSEEYRLWKRLREGDQEALEKVYSMYADDLIGYGMQITNNVQMTEDAVHDIFLGLMTHGSRISQISDIRPYLYRALRNNLLRKIKREQKTNGSLETIDSFTLVDNINTGGLDDEQKSILSKISKLSRLEREIIYLRFFENLTNNQICQVLRLKNQTIKNVLSKALKKLRCYITYKKTGK